MIMPRKPSIEPIDRSMLRVTMTSAMPVAMMATGDDCTDRFHRLRGVRNNPPESTCKAIQISSSAPTMPSMRVSSSVALRKRARGGERVGMIVERGGSRPLPLIVSGNSVLMNVPSPLAGEGIAGV